MAVEEKIDQKNKKQAKKTFLRKLMKFFAWTIVAVVLLVCGLLQAATSVLQPQRLTPLTEKYLSQMLNADVSVKRVELSVWKKFPNVTLEIDSLAIVSNALDGINDDVRGKLPENADSLVAFKYFHGGVKLYEFLFGTLSLYDIKLHEPMVNLVSVDSTLANYDILPPSAPDTVAEDVAVEDTVATELPHIFIDRFEILNAVPIRYFSLSDTVDVSINVKNLSVEGEKDPKYAIDFNSTIESPLLSLINQSKSPFIINGGIEWDQSKQYVLKLNDFTIGADIFTTHINSELDFSNDMLVNTLKMSLDAVKYADLATRVPKEYSAMLEGIESNAMISLGMELTKPFNVSVDTIPYANVTLAVPECYLNSEKFKVDKFKTNIITTLNGNDLDDAVINISDMSFDGLGVKCHTSTKVSHIMSDPLIDGAFDGMVTLDNLPSVVSESVAGTMTGVLNANTTFKLRQSYLTSNDFHNAKLKGDAKLSKFRYNSNDSLTNVYLRTAELKLGTNESFIKDTQRTDSLLTASVMIDTTALYYDGYDIRLSNLKAGVGCTNKASSADSTVVNPIGGTIKMGRLNFFSEEDSMKVRLRDVNCFAMLRRFKKMEKVPMLMLKMDARSVGAATKEMRVSLRESNISVMAHLKPRDKKMSSMMQATYDKILKENPGLSNDSIYAMARREWRAKMAKRRAKNDDSEVSTVDFGLDRSTRALLYRWNVKGSIKAKSARMFTPYFPLRNRLSGVDVEFTTDSVAFNNMEYKAGRSNFTVVGAISNIKRALSGRSDQQLKMAFMMRSDTIDVNQLAEAIFAGAAYSENATIIDMSATENEDVLETTIANQTDSVASTALLVPMNIDALLRVTAKNVIYSDMLMKNLSGNVQVYRGSLRFDQLRASTDMGSVNMSALYSAPTKKDINVGFGLQLKKLDIDKVLDLVPAVDSIMPLMRDIKGIINADIAATADVDTAMNIMLPSLNAAIKLSGDSLVLMDAETFKTVAKWLLFKNKGKNMIDKMTVEVLVKDSQLELFPFMFNIDRYKLGILGYNDMAMNYNYHVSVLESPIPFKFGVTLKGDIDNMKIRLGRAKFKENMVGERVAIVDTTRINLLRQIENVFRRGIDRSSRLNLNIDQRVERFDDEQGDTISKADSLLFIQEGLIPAPPVPQDSVVEEKPKKKNWLW